MARVKVPANHVPTKGREINVTVDDFKEALTNRVVDRIELPVKVFEFPLIALELEVHILADSLFQLVDLIPQG